MPAVIEPESEGVAKLLEDARLDDAEIVARPALDAFDDHTNGSTASDDEADT